MRAKQKNEDWSNVITVGSSIYDIEMTGTPKGEHSKQLKLRKAYERRIWWVLILLVILAIIYGM